MPDGILEDLEFEHQWETLPEENRLKFIALQSYKASKCIAEFKTQLINHEERLVSLEKLDGKKSLIAGGTTGGIAGIISFVVYFIGKKLGFWD